MIAMQVGITKVHDIACMALNNRKYVPRLGCGFCWFVLLVLAAIGEEVVVQVLDFLVSGAKIPYHAITNSSTL